MDALQRLRLIAEPFLLQVRRMVDAIVLVGEGRRNIDDIRSALCTGKSSRLQSAAPAEGLYLVQVDYPRDAKGKLIP